MLSRGLMFLAVCGLGFGCADGIPAEIPEPETQTFAEPEAAPLDPPEGDWWWWRGPTRNGKAAAGQTIPTSWSRTDNVVWKVNVPGRGHSSPTVVGSLVVMATADESAQTQSVVAFDRETGKRKWMTELSQGGFPKTHPKNTHASTTVASDGKYLFAVFHHHDELTLHALDFEGHEVWKRDIGRYAPRRYEYGYAPSPLLMGSLIVIAADYEEGGYIAAFDRKTGEPTWKTERPAKLSFSSPVLADVGGKEQIFLSGCEIVASYDPKTGQQNWAVPGTTMATCGTMVWDGDAVIASGGYPKSETICVKADGSKQVLWTNNQKCYEQSMMAHEGYVYALTDKGVAYCWRVSDGEELWRERLSGPVSASPVLVGDKIYQANEKGEMFIFKANPSQYEEVARVTLGDESFASPAVCGNRLYLRVAHNERGKRQEVLYCIGQ